MTKTTNLNLPFIHPKQAQKHVTQNEALKMLDVLVQLSVVDNSLSMPPQSPSEGDSYTIFSSPTGDWENHENHVAIWHDQAWSFYPPNLGWIAWVESNNSLQAYNGTHWVDVSGVLSASTALKLGINAAADTTNRLSVNSAAVLFNKEVDDVQVKLNKQTISDNASFLFQTNFSGRAEIGTTGDDDFHFKVSSDGTNWNDGILINKSTGEVSFPNTILSAAGSTGTKGDKGDKGDIGATGAKGDKGDRGDAGAAGLTGATGSKGDAGADGINGQDGATGPKGDKGDTGATGAKGDTGATGSKGDKGNKGDGLEIDEEGNTAGRSSHDTAAKGFTFLDSEANLLYIKNTSTSGDWSTGIPFGKGEKGDAGNIGLLDIDNLVTRIFTRYAPTQWGFCYLASESHTNLAKTTKAVSADDVVAVIEDKSPNNLDLIAGGTDAANKIKLRLNPISVGVDEAHLTTHFLKVTVPTGGFKGKLIMAYRSGCIVSDVNVPAGDWEIWSGHSLMIKSGFIGAFAAENISRFDAKSVAMAFHNLGAGSKPIISASNISVSDTDKYYHSTDFSFFDFSNVTTLSTAFKYGGFHKITVAGDDFHNVTNVNAMFQACSSLKNMDISNWNIPNAVSFSYIFRDCAALRHVNISALGVLNVTHMNHMFLGATSLEFFEANKLDTSNVTLMNNMFLNCTALKVADISNWDTANVENMSYMFHYCTSLSDINISSWNTANVVNTSRMFNSCASLRIIDISTLDFSSLTNASYMFNACVSLTRLVVGGAFDNTPCIDFANAFTNGAFDQQSVDGILVSIEKAGTSNGTLHMTGGTSSAPSSAGTTAKTALVGRGWTVTTQ